MLSSKDPSEVTETTNVGASTPRSSALPLVALVGRPNVGKSTLFNRLIGFRKAIVHDLPGVTRDRNVEEASWDGRRFRLGDTGGIELDATGLIPSRVRDIALLAAAEADVVVLVVDGRAGVLPLDADVARRLRAAGARHLMLAVNKVDSAAATGMALEFARLGIEPVFAISAETGLGLPELLDAVVEALPAGSATAPAEEAVPEIGVALIGRPNVGKSTLFNALVGGERSLVSEVAGTTRDSVDMVLDREGARYRFLDTAGIRRPGRTERGPEVLSVVMAKKSIERADVVLLVLDATEGIAHQDAAVAGMADEAGKPLCIVLTKWDLVEDPPRRRKALDEEVRRKLKFLAYAPLLTASGKTRRGTKGLLDEVRRLAAASAIRVPTPRINRFVKEELASIPIAAPGAHDAHILYATQTGIKPPTFVLFMNRRVEPHFSTVRRITNRIREGFGLEGTPIRLRFRSRGKE